MIQIKKKKQIALIKKVAILNWKKCSLCNPNYATGQFIFKKHFSITNVHTNLGIVRTFLRKNQLFYVSLMPGQMEK